MGIGAGGIALAISPFLSWIHVSLLGLSLAHFSFFNILTIANKPKSYAYIVVGVGVAITLLALAINSRRLMRTLGLLATLVVGGALAATSYKLVQIVSRTHHILGVGPGVYLAAAAEAAFVIGTIFA
jgi:hypothetical protein